MSRTARTSACRRRGFFVLRMRRPRSSTLFPYTTLFRSQERREREVRVARGVGTADLGARRLLRARLVERDPDQRGAVPLRPGHVHRRLVAGHEPLVRVDPLREDGRDLTRVPELAGYERLADVGEVPAILGVEERVAAVGEERLVGVHPGAVLAE